MRRSTIVFSRENFAKLGYRLSKPICFVGYQPPKCKQNRRVGLIIADI